MVGGIVIGLSRTKESTLLHVQDTTYKQTCSVRCGNERLDNGDKIVVMTGDHVWWQCGKVYWTPGGVADRDIPLKKIGYSH